MLERYRPQNTLRNRTRKKQLDSLLQQPDPRLYEQARKRRQEAEFRERVESIESQVPDTQESPEVVTAQELRKPAGGTEAELGLEQPDKRNVFARFGEDVLSKITGAQKSFASGVAYLGTTDLPFTDKTPLEIANEHLPRSVRGPLQFGALNELGKSLREKGVNASDFFSTEVGKDGELPESQKKIIDSYDQTDLGDYSTVNDAVEFGLNTIGISTIDDKGILEDIAGIFNPYAQADRILKPSVASTNAKMYLEAAIKGEPVPENLTNIPEFSKKFGLELTYDPLNFVEAGLVVKAARAPKTLSKFQLGRDTLARAATSDGLILNKNVLLNADEAEEVISYERLRRAGLGNEDLPTRAGFEVGEQVASILGYKRRELVEIFEQLTTEIDNAKYFNQPKVKQSFSKQQNLDPNANPVTFIGGKIRTIEESEALLKKLNNFLVNDEVISAQSRGSFTADLLRDTSGVFTPSTRKNVRYGNKTPSSPFKKASDIDVNAKTLFETPTGATVLSGETITSASIKGKVQRFIYGFISPRAIIGKDALYNFDNPSDYLEAAHQVYLQQTRAIPDLIEKSPAFAELKEIGSPFRKDPVAGITHIGDTEITEKLLRDLGIKVPPKTDDGKLIIPTSEFYGKFFTTTGNQQYWKLVNSSGNIARNVGEAAATPTGKYVRKFQKIFEDRLEEMFARSINGYDRSRFFDQPFLKGESYVSRVAAQIIKEGTDAEKALLAGASFDPTKLRVLDEQSLQQFVKDGGRYQNDEFDIIRTFLNSTYKKQFDDELLKRTQNIAALKLDEGLYEGRKILDDEIDKLQDSLLGKIPSTPVNLFNKLRYNFPELTEDFQRTERLTGREREMALKALNKQIEAIKKNPNSVYGQRSRQIDQVAQETEQLANEYASFAKNTEFGNPLVDENLARASRKKIADALGKSDVADFDSELMKALKSSPTGKAFLTIGKRGLELAERTGNIMKGIMANFDLAAPLLQGQFILARDPKSWAQGTKLMIDSLNDERYYYQFISQHSDTIQKMIDGGIPLGARTSDFFYLYTKGGKDFDEGSRIARLFGKLTGKSYFSKSDIPVYQMKSKIGRKLQGTYSDPLDAYKILTYEAYEPLIKNAQELDELHHFIRASTGSMDTAAMGIGQTQQAIENTLAFFSPRLFRGIVALTVDAFRGNLRGELAREAWAKLVTAQFILMKEYADITGGELNIDPSSGNFGSVVLPGGNTVGFSQTLTAPMRLLAESAEITMEGPEAMKAFVSKTATETSEGRTFYNPLTRILRSKSSVFGGTVWNIATGEDYFGYDVSRNPFDLEFYKDLPVPLPFAFQAAIIDDVSRAAREPDYTLPFIGTELDFYWLQALNPLGVKEYPQSNWAYLYNTRDEIAARRFPSGTGKLTEWRDLSRLQREGLENPPSEILEGLSESEKAQILNDAAVLKRVSEKVYANVTDPNTPEFMEEYYDSLNAIEREARAKIDALTETLKQGGLASSPRQYESAMQIFRRKRKEITDDKYDAIEKIISTDVESYHKEQSAKNPENSIKFYLDLYNRKVFDNPANYLEDGEFDYQAMQEADRNFLQYDLDGNKDLYDQIVSIRFQKKDLNEFEAEVVIGHHIFGGKYWQGADTATLNEFPDVERIYYDRYQGASPDFKRVLRDENPRLAEFISVRNKVRDQLRMNDPYLDAWVYRNGYDNELLSDAWRINGEPNPLELYALRDVIPVDWSQLMRNRKQVFPEYY